MTVAIKIPLVNLREQYDALKPSIDAAIASVLARSAYIGGPEVDEFERWFAAFCGVAHAIGVSSGTRAIELSLRAARIGVGDEVIGPANTFIATAAAIVAAGARPVLVDVDERTGNIDPERVESAITPRTKAMIPVHLYGRPAAMRPLLDIAARRKLLVFEDAAQAHGARYRGARAGSLGAAGCFSFYPTKNLGAFGDGGIVTTNDEQLASRIRLLRDHGRSSKYEHAVVGYTARLDNLQAAILRVQADVLDQWNARRRQVAAWYTEALPKQVVFMTDDSENEPVHHVFAVRVPKRDDFRTFLEAHGVATAVHYPVPLHLQPALRMLGYRAGDFPATERLARDIVSLPMHPFLQPAEVRYVADVAAEYLSRC